MLSIYGIEENYRFVIHYSYIEDYSSHNGLETFNDFGIKTRDIHFLWGHLYFGYIVIFTMLVG